MMQHDLVKVTVLNRSESDVPIGLERYIGSIGENELALPKDHAFTYLTDEDILTVMKVLVHITSSQTGEEYFLYSLVILPDDLVFGEKEFESESLRQNLNEVIEAVVS